MITSHTAIFKNAASMYSLPSDHVDLIVTSPPYPMIEMWDEIFFQQNPMIEEYLKIGQRNKAFEAMHKILDPVWQECFRILKPGGFACINIGDATRNIEKHFALYPNHARILSSTFDIGFTSLPSIIWRKQTNSPNKFMGSGMLPAGAYVTLEHEYILILRKKGKRIFAKEEEKQHRRESALFWEERNAWFSDVWFDLKGTVQQIHDKANRTRSAAFPFELPYRLINMYSLKGDLVLDPFLGTGTTMLGAAVAERNSVGYEADSTMSTLVKNTMNNCLDIANKVISKRLKSHVDFILERQKKGNTLKHENFFYKFKVITAQEKHLLLHSPIKLQSKGKHTWHIEYDTNPSIL